MFPSPFSTPYGFNTTQLTTWSTYIIEFGPTTAYFIMCWDLPDLTKKCTTCSRTYAMNSKWWRCNLVQHLCIWLFQHFQKIHCIFFFWVILCGIIILHRLVSTAEWLFLKPLWFLPIRAILVHGYGNLCACSNHSSYMVLLVALKRYQQILKTGHTAMSQKLVVHKFSNY